MSKKMASMSGRSTTRESSSAGAVAKEIRRLVRGRPDEVREVVAAFRKLSSGRRRELGPMVPYIMSLLEKALVDASHVLRRKKVATKKSMKK